MSHFRLLTSITAVIALDSARLPHPDRLELRPPAGRIESSPVRHVGVRGQITHIAAPTVWRRGATIRLDGPVLVDAGGTLRIEAGTRIEGVVGAYVVISRDGRLEAPGTLNEPIVLTCNTVVKYPGCWGGLVVHGYARINSGSPTSPTSSRSVTPGCLSALNPVVSNEPYGGCNDADDSGIMTYLRIEYAERGLQLAGVGSGTVVRDVQANRTRNEGVLIDGGTVGVKDLFLTANATGLRWTGGWRGQAQFIAVQQDFLRFAAGIAGQNGTTSATSDAAPRSNPTLFNITLVAQSDPANASHATARALVLERGTAGTIRNVFFYAPHIALDIAGTSTCAQFNAGALTLQHVLTAGATSLGAGADAAGCASNEAALLGSAGANNTVLTNASGLLKSENDLILPDLRPITGAPLATAPAALPPTDGIFSAASYIGAVPEAGPGNRIPWFSGWTSPAPTPAPIPDGILAGVVRSPLRGILGNTVVTDVATGTTTTADASGRYTLTLPAGTALLEVSAVPADCPAPATRSAAVQPNMTTTLDLLVNCPPLPGTQRIAAGSAFACALADVGTYCWGENSFGQLGNGSTSSSLLPSLVPVSTTSISAGSAHTCALRPDGLVRCWGSNAFGQIGDGSTVDRSSPTPGAGGPFTVVSAGGQHTCALASSGRTYCWGSNSNGQLGTGSTNGSLVAVELTGVPLFATIATGSTHTCALDLLGAAWCWGANADGQLGDGTRVDRLRPVAVAGGRFYKALAAGNGVSHACATEAGGAVRCWGSNEFGQLGTNAVTQSSIPVVVNTAVPLKDVAVGDRHTCGISESTSRSYCWGQNTSGQVGDGTTQSRNTPTEADASAVFSRMTAGTNFTCAVTFGAVTGEDNIIVISRRSLLCWGLNGSGQFGRGNTTSSTTPAAAATGLTIP